MSVEVFASALLTLAGDLFFDPSSLKETNCSHGSNYTCYSYKDMIIISWFTHKDSDYFDFGVITTENPIGKLDCHNSTLIKFDNYTLDYKYEKFQISRCIFPGGVLSSFLSSQKQIEYLILEQVTMKIKSLLDFEETKMLSGKAREDWINSRVTDYLFTGPPSSDILQDDIFSGLTNIKHISLVKSGLSSIRSGKFVDQRNLVELHLNDNKIEMIDSDAFVNLESLEVLSLQNNRLKSISTWLSYCGNLRVLNASRNAIEETKRSFESLGKLKILDLSHNHLNYLEVMGLLHKNMSPNNYFNPIAYLNLSHNKIGRIDTWDSYMQFVELDLSYNSIHHFLVDIIRLVEQNSTINLSHNKLNKIVIADLESIRFDEATIQFIMYGNMIECDCGLSPLVNNFNQKIVVNFDNMSICYYPLALRKEPLNTLTPQMIQCKCPSDCSCHLNRLNRIQVVKCVNADLPLVIPKYALFNKLALKLGGGTVDSFDSSSIITNGHIVGLDLSENSISDLSKVDFPEKLKVLDLRKNLIVDVKEETVNLLKLHHYDTYLYVSENPIACSCDNWPFISYLKEKNFKESLELRCEDGKTLGELSATICYEKIYKIVIYIIIIAAVLYYIHRKCYPKIVQKQKYDVYLLHAPNDFNYVLQNVMPTFLERGLKVLGDDKFISRDEKSLPRLNECETIVILVSSALIEAVWSKPELKDQLTDLIRDRPADVSLLRSEDDFDHPELVKCGGSAKDPDYSLRLGMGSVRCYRLTDVEFLDLLPKAKGGGKVKYLRNEEAVQFP